MIETLILIGVGAFVAGAALGWWLAEKNHKPDIKHRDMPYDDGRKLPPPPCPIIHDVHVAKVSQQQAEELLDLIFPNLAKHPYRHPEMEEDNDH